MPRILPILAIAAAIAWARERQSRQAAERFGAALFESLLNAIDANDEMTGDHVRRVAAISLELARAAGCDVGTQREVEHVALFHDVGKIHAALFDVVHESHELSAHDRAAIATHPARGAEVLAPLEPFYPYLAEGVLSHHERWDGTGYPRGLAGEAIPLPARIVAIADSFDAITHARRYQAGRSTEAGLAAIRTGSGSQFDPALADLFVTAAVQRRIRDCTRELTKPAHHERRHRARHEPFAPDVTFRWRERRSAGYEPEAATRGSVGDRPRADGSGAPKVVARPGV